MGHTHMKTLKGNPTGCRKSSGFQYRSWWIYCFSHCQAFEERVTKGVDHMFNLAADMGGMGFIQSNHSVIMYNNTMISFNTIEAARINGVKRDTDMSGGVPFFYRCVCTKREHYEA
ncbi:GDP-mannose 3,5-epimerase [Sesamum angolense]|uniref:GDP-mannose 3,5-epimerase n=1 Tax=Sesamum angolense TaxID=2727404 RepID=A0AAE1T7J6_9LAMI|nr:GDP-mannose 3,5-epimerase [Sesamum angolense]